MKIHLVSSTEFANKGTGVHSAYLDMIDLLQEQNDVTVVKNQEGRGDIFHSHSYGLYYFLMSRNDKGRRIHTVHTTAATLKGSVIFSNLFFPFAKFYFKLVFNHADVCITISPMVEKNLMELGIKSKIINIGNPINLDKWYPSAIKRTMGKNLLNLKNDNLVVLGVGQLQKRKGVEDFIELGILHPHLNFVWVGSRPFGAITEGINRINLKIEKAPKNIKFIGQVPFDSMPLVYAASDIFLFPSYQENCPLAPIEAAAAQLPVIFRDPEGYKLLYNSAYLKANGTTEFSKIITALSEDEEYLQNAKHLSSDLVKQFDKNEIRKKLISLYENVYEGLQKVI